MTTRRKLSKQDCVLSVFSRSMFPRAVRVRLSVLSVMGIIMCCFVELVNLIVTLITYQVNRLSPKNLKAK